jgi:hypothetical protein
MPGVIMLVPLLLAITTPQGNPSERSDGLAGRLPLFAQACETTQVLPLQFDDAGRLLRAEGPIVILLSTDGVTERRPWGTESWVSALMPEHLVFKIGSATDVKTLVCISETTPETPGIYLPSHVPAHERKWWVWLVQWPAGCAWAGRR